MRLGQTLAVAALSISALAACNSTRAPISGPQVSQFRLQAVDGHALPYLVSQSADSTTKVVLTDLILSVAEDASWYTTGHQTVTTNGASADQVVHGSGTFVVHDSGATFNNANDAVVYQGVFSDTPPKFTLTDSLSHVYVFCGQGVDPAMCVAPPPPAPSAAR